MTEHAANAIPEHPRTRTDLPLLAGLSGNWWLLLLRGVAAIVFGLMTFFWPAASIVALALLWGAYAVVDGLFSLWAAFSGRAGRVAPRWWLALVGLLGLAAGAAAFAWPAITALVLLMFLAGWLIAVGALQVWGAIQIRKEVEGEIWLALAGFLSIAVGVLLVLQPAAGLLAMVWIVGIAAIVIGISYIALAMRLKKLRPRPGT